jgi:hypothetical protein
MIEKVILFFSRGGRIAQSPAKQGLTIKEKYIRAQNN